MRCSSLLCSRLSQSIRSPAIKDRSRRRRSSAFRSLSPTYVPPLLEKQIVEKDRRKTMGTVRDEYSSFIGWLGSKDFISLRVEILVLLTAICSYYLVYIAMIRRLHLGQSPGVRFIFWASYTLSSILVSYTLAFINSLPFKNELFVVCAVYVLLVLGCNTSISSYSLQDNEKGVRYLAQNFVQVATVFWCIIATRTNGALVHTSLLVVLLLLWFISIMKIVRRYAAYNMGSSSKGLLEDSTAIAAYMASLDLSVEEDGANARTLMTGYKFLISSSLYLNGNPKVDLTTEMVWLDNRLSQRDKEVCLAFALFRMLKRRFAGYKIPESELAKTREFVLQRLLSEDVGDDGANFDRAFRIMELELGFFYDLFYTTRPTVLKTWNSLYNLLSLALVATMVWILVILFSYKTPAGQINHIVNGINFDAAVTIAIIIAVSFVELQEFVFLICSDWTRILYAYSVVVYNENLPLKLTKRLPFICVELKFSIGRKFTHRTESTSPVVSPVVFNQYLLLEDSQSYRSMMLEILTCILVDSKYGRKLVSRKIQSPITVKGAVLRSLKDCNGHLTDGRVALRRLGVSDRLSWACTIESQAEKILVWHIATTFCKSIDPQIVDSSVDHFAVPFKLSNYCAYLVARAPDLLPEHIYDTRLVFDKARRQAKDFFRGYRSMHSKCRKLGEPVDMENNSDNIMVKGAKLGQQLREELDDPRRWELLSEFWAEFMLFLTPSDKAIAHAEKLTTGAEFITQLWVLLNHAGIVERPAQANGGIAERPAQANGGIAERPAQANAERPAQANGGITESP